MIEWQVKSSYAAELTNFLWSIGEGRICSRAYPKEKAFWRSRLGNGMALSIDQFVDFDRTAMSQYNLGTVLHFSNAESLDQVMDALEDLEQLKSLMLETRPRDLEWVDSVFMRLGQSKALLQQILEALKWTGYDEYWRAKILPVVSRKCEELEAGLSDYSVGRILAEINDLLGPRYHLDFSPKPIYLTYFGYALAYRVPDNSSVHSFKADRPIETGKFVGTFTHELLHNYDPGESVREHLNRLLESQFLARNHEMRQYYWGTPSDEDLIIAAEKYISVRLGAVSDESAFHHLYTNYDGTSVLGVVIYDNMSAEKLGHREYDRFLLSLFHEGIIQPATLEDEYYRILQKHVGAEEAEKRREHHRNIYARYINEKRS